jgi:hypothetical protein
VSPPKKSAISLTGSQVAPGLLIPVGPAGTDGVAAADRVADVLDAGDVAALDEQAASSMTSTTMARRRIPL